MGNGECRMGNAVQVDTFRLPASSRRCGGTSPRPDRRNYISWPRPPRTRYASVRQPSAFPCRSAAYLVETRSGSGYAGARMQVDALMKRLLGLLPLALLVAGAG